MRNNGAVYSAGGKLLMGITVKDPRYCIMCNNHKPLTEFYRYAYTTNQGKRKKRYNSECKECSAVKRRERYKKNKDKSNAQNKAWRENNKEYRGVYFKERQARPEVKAMKAAAQRRRKARMKAGMATKDEDPRIKELYDIALRLEEITGTKYHVDHVIPISIGGTHTVDNLQVITETENLQKGVKAYSVLNAVRL